ncbi:MAG: hypothetical protein A2089_11245 [Elusimicrobia bacterium GWD2_63_28]|nr:MAG: hypothetical protein A2089_11245 [Elusimicrobia bacterium GWD2_63_28]
MKKIIFCFALAAAACGPAAAEYFPLGFYGISAPGELATLKAAGFNSFHTYTQDPARLAALAKEAKKQGLKMLAYPDRVIDSSYSKQAKRWPMLGWYLFDEPEVKRLPLASLQALDARVKAWDKRQPTVFVMGEGVSSFIYGGVADNLMVDWYPVPHLTLESVGEQVAMAKAGAAIMDPVRQAKPVWAVLQAFDWINYPQRRSPRVGGFPTFEQVRYMTWLSIARGATGIFYFQYTGSDNIPLSARPERWSTYQRIAAELNSFRKVLEKGKPGVVPPGLDPAYAVRSIKQGGRTYLILLNPTAAPLSLEPVKDWRPLYELSRYLPDTLPPQKVLILER